MHGNFATLIVASILFTVCYIKSVKPESLSREIGQTAYKLCERYGIVSGIFMTVAAINYTVFYWFPLPGLPESLRAFHWPYTTSQTVGLASLRRALGRGGGVDGEVGRIRMFSKYLGTVCNRDFCSPWEALVSHATKGVRRVRNGLVPPQWPPDRHPTAGE